VAAQVQAGSRQRRRRGTTSSATDPAAIANGREPAPPLGYQAGLDGVRAVAILSVMASHAVDTFRGGGLGVDMFFVLSGFLITTLVLEELRASKGNFGFANFYVRRMLRLFPALYTMLLAITVYVLVVGPDNGDQLLPAVGMTALYLGNVAFLFGISLNWLGHTWSLALEEQFYLVWPIVLVTFVRRKRLLQLLGLLVLVVLVVLVYRLAVGIDPDGWVLQRPDALVVGCVTAIVRWLWPDRLRAACRPVAVGAIAFGLLALQIVGDARWVSEDAFVKGLFLVVSLSTAALVGHVVSRPADDPRGSPVVRGLAMTPFRQIGRISYGLYLWHYPIFAFVKARTSLTGLGAIAVELVATFAVAITSWFLIERRALRLKRRFASKGGTKEPVV
jgi:peptidoglycan/LPS O-acetylase OafA/YrhL